MKEELLDDIAFLNKWISTLEEKGFYPEIVAEMQETVELKRRQYLNLTEDELL